MPRITDFDDLFQDLQCARGVLSSAFQLPARTLLVDGTGEQILQQTDFHHLELIPWNIETLNVARILFRLAPRDQIIQVHKREIFQEMEGQFIRNDLELGAVIASDAVFRESPFPGVKLYAMSWGHLRKEQEALQQRDVLQSFVALSKTAALRLQNEEGRAYAVKLDEVFTFQINSKVLRANPTPAIKKKPPTVWDYLKDDDDADA